MGQLPLITVLPPWTVPFGAGAGSLQVITGSPTRAAGLLLISTVALPLATVPELVGGTWNDPPGGMCGGEFVSVLPAVAAGMLWIRTFVLQQPVMVPENGNCIGVGTGPPGDGTRMMWRSDAVTMSPCLAAGGI